MVLYARAQAASIVFAARQQPSSGQKAGGLVEAADRLAEPFHLGEQLEQGFGTQELGRGISASAPKARTTGSRLAACCSRRVDHVRVRLKTHGCVMRRMSELVMAA